MGISFSLLGFWNHSSFLVHFVGLYFLNIPCFVTFLLGETWLWSMPVLVSLGLLSSPVLPYSSPTNRGNAGFGATKHQEMSFCSSHWHWQGFSALTFRSATTDGEGAFQHVWITHGKEGMWETWNKPIQSKSWDPLDRWTSHTWGKSECVNNSVKRQTFLIIFWVCFREILVLDP